METHKSQKCLGLGPHQWVSEASMILLYNFK